ncbi:hypothetical protein MMC14_003635 [Varicellaria rhodocarpa]|nr:hypothetical protein [Varicellaria rhodocarpa]
MSLNQGNPEPTPNHHDDNSTVYTAINTPSDTTAAESAEDHDWFGRGNPTSGPFLVPWPGSTFIIRSVSSGHVITLLDGQVVLTQPGDNLNRGSICWACVETKGWLGFRNTVSGTFLGHDKKGRLCCVAKQHQGWERFCARMKPEGGCVLLMQHWERLWNVEMVEVEQGAKKLAKVEDGGLDGMVWEFIKI